MIFRLWTVVLLMLPIWTVAQDIKSTKVANITFLSDAPLELISATSKECHGVLNLDNNEFAFRVKIRSFEGFNSPLQKEHFNENYMESSDMPFATYTGIALDEVDFTAPGEFSILLKGSLDMHGVEDERVIELDIVVSADGSISFEAEFEVELMVHDIDVPKIVYQKISKTIFITVNGELK